MKDGQTVPGGRFARELRSWVGGLLLAVPIWVAVWFLGGLVHGPWVRPVLALLAILPPLAIGWLSRSSIWVLIVWLTPLIIVIAVIVAVPRTSLGLAVTSAIVIVWTGVLMLYESVSEPVFRLADSLLTRLIDAGLPAPKRAAYRAFRGASRRNLELRDDEAQLEDLPRTIRALREAGARYQALATPDCRWKEMFESCASPFLRYADMLERNETLNYDAMKLLFEERDGLFTQLLRYESLIYRVLAYVPRH